MSYRQWNSAGGGFIPISGGSASLKDPSSEQCRYRLRLRPLGAFEIPWARLARAVEGPVGFELSIAHGLGVESLLDMRWRHRHTHAVNFGGIFGLLDKTKEFFAVECLQVIGFLVSLDLVCHSGCDVAGDMVGIAVAVVITRDEDDGVVPRSRLLWVLHRKYVLGFVDFVVGGWTRHCGCSADLAGACSLIQFWRRNGQLYMQ